MEVSQMSGELAMQWIPVVDARGRTHMEARWTTVNRAASATPSDIAHAITHAA